MINHHPSWDVLKEFVSGTLHPSVSIVVSSHVEMCSECKAKVAKLTEQLALETFDFSSETLVVEEDTLAEEFDLSLIDSITSLDTEKMVPIASMPATVTELELSGERIKLPRAIKSIALKDWQGIGKISRARLNFDDEERRVSLLHIDKEGHVPQHTHKGFEITLLLQGSFEDEMGTYEAGDFIWLDGEHNHSPYTREGCVCLTVSSDALQFTQGVSKLINPLGKLIY